MSQPTVLKEFGFDELITIREYFDCRIPTNEEDPNMTEFMKSCIEERNYLDRFILAKWKKIKADSLIKK